MELADDGTNDVPDVRALVMEMMTNLFISTYNHQVTIVAVTNCIQSCNDQFIYIYVPVCIIPNNHYATISVMYTVYHCVS